MSEALQDYRITIEAFRAFIDDRPDWEKWELIDGEIVLNPTATNRHQIIVGNLHFELETIRRRSESSWHPIPGHQHARILDDQHNEPIPDVDDRAGIVRCLQLDLRGFAVFEVLSPYSTAASMVHKRQLLPADRQPDALRRACAGSDARRRCSRVRTASSHRELGDVTARIEIAELGVVLQLADLYRDVPIG